MINNIYTIDKVKFKLKPQDNYTFDEKDELSDLFKDLSTADNFINIKQSNQQAKRFLELVLEPIGNLPDNFSFGKATNKVSTDVTKDFFLSMIISKSDIPNL